jgi:hypothetical protein
MDSKRFFFSSTLNVRLREPVGFRSQKCSEKRNNKNLPKRKEQIADNGQRETPTTFWGRGRTLIATTYQMPGSTLGT